MWNPLRSPAGEVLPRLGKPGDSYRHYFPAVLNIVQVGSFGRGPRAKGTLSKFARLWVPVNGTQ